MTTATKTTSALVELEQLERERDNARTRSRQLSREESDLRDRLRALLEERAGLIYQEPTLVDHAGQPADKSNAVAKLDAEIAKVPDLDEAIAKARHAQAVADREEQRVAAFRSANGDRLVADIAPAAREQASQVNDAFDVLREKLDEHLHMCQRIESFGHRNRDLDAAAGLLKSLKGAGVSAPVELG